MMVGFDPTALARLLTRWKALATDPVWRQARHELMLVIAVSPFREAHKLPESVAAVDPSGGDREIPPAREKASSLFANLDEGQAAAPGDEAA